MGGARALAPAIVRCRRACPCRTVAAGLWPRRVLRSDRLRVARAAPLRPRAAAIESGSAAAAAAAASFVCKDAYLLGCFLLEGEGGVMRERRGLNSAKRVAETLTVWHVQLLREVWQPGAPTA
eukprot:TRINITY_DN103_c0_g1_i14.p2 TRINITY_DN103_c0_g1~~TRINITY_DN103_c0_g1_i14.p2  ORF type:complete len:123 (-),score=12.46 TRINITY_DN103_c0_g1_i14:305-673(-)